MRERRLAPALCTVAMFSVSVWTPAGLDHGPLASGCGRSFFLTSLLIELIDPRSNLAGKQQRRKPAKAGMR
jgi:hypothetical protein